MSLVSHLRLVVALSCATTACGGSDEEAREVETRPNVVLITLDTVRADHVGCYGYFRDTTPALDELAQQSLVFEQCMAPIAHTGPSHLSLLTGVYPYEHGMLSNNNQLRRARDGSEAGVGVQVGEPFVPTEELRSFAELVQSAGYETGGFVSALPLKRVTGLAHGFDAWGEPEGARRSAEETLPEILSWLDEQPSDRPYFLFAHFYDAHGPYALGTQPPEPYDTFFSTDENLDAYLAERDFAESVEGARTPKTTPAHIVDLYDGSVRWLDDQIRVLFERLYARPDWERTVVVVVGDHGQGLGQHDYLPHGTVWQEQIHVPLLMRIPGRAPRRVSNLISMVDVLSTAIGAASGFEAEGFLKQSQGINVLAAGAEPRPIFAMSPPERGLEAITDGRWKYIRTEDESPELYDLSTDPFELENLAEKNPEQAARMGALLSALTEGQHVRGAVHLSRISGETVIPFDEEHLEQLEALGY